MLKSLPDYSLALGKTNRTDTVQKSIFIITGGPGFGKTELINELRNIGYSCSGEFAHDLIEQQQAIGGDILPWKKPKLFQQEILKRRIAFFESVKENEIAFADRGIPDQLAFARYKGFGAPEIIANGTREYRYASLVFVTPPWQAIFENNVVRTESFPEAVAIHNTIVETYSSLNYQLIELPLVSVKNRADFILQILLKYQAI